MPINENELEQAIEALRMQQQQREEREMLELRGIVRLEPEESDFGAGFWDTEVLASSTSSDYNMPYQLYGYQGAAAMPISRRSNTQTFPLTWEAVNSKAVKAIAYNKRDKVLYVLFNKGQLYSYNEVTKYKMNKIAEAALSGSVGDYLNKSIIGKPEQHPCTLLGQKSE